MKVTSQQQAVLEKLATVHENGELEMPEKVSDHDLKALTQNQVQKQNTDIYSDYDSEVQSGSDDSV